MTVEEIPKIYHDYRASGGAAQLFLSNEPEILMDGPAGTGKTRAILQKIHYLCEMYPGCRALICRATRTSMTESVLVTLERDVLPPDHPGMLRAISRGQRDNYDYANGSVIVCGGIDHPERLYSTEWDVVYVPEAIEITEDSWERFGRAMRSSQIPKGVGGGPQQPGEDRCYEPDPQTGEPRPAWWTQRIADTNPGAPAHWLNQRCLQGRMQRILSRHEDNPAITKGYLDELRRLTGHRRARLYEGRWVSAEGSVYPEFDRDIHVVPAFDVPADWPWYAHWDPGYAHPTAIVWMTVGPNGRFYLADEQVQAGQSVEQHCAEFMRRAKGRNIQRVLGDPHHAFNRTAQSLTTIAEQAAKCGVRMYPGPSCRNSAEIEAQVNLVRQRLTTMLPDGRPGLVVFSKCHNVIRGFESWSYKRNKDGSLPGGDDRFEDVGDDEMDCVRSLVAFNPQRGNFKVTVT